MDPLRRWIAFTCRKNPAFPLSTLLLVFGLWLLSGEEEADAANLLGIAAGLGLLSAFLLTLIGLAALVLWPRRVHYETASALRVFSVFRYALPFVVTSYAVDGGDPLAALLLGVTVAAFVGLAGEFAVRRIGLRIHAWERGYDCGLYAFVAIGLPLFAHVLAYETGQGISFGGARATAVAAWWVLALLLLPLVFGVGTIASARPLRSRLPAFTGRAVALIVVPVLVWHALWTAGQEAPLFAYLPLALLVQVAAARGATALGYTLAPWTACAPAATLALALMLPEVPLLGRVPVCSQALAVFALAPLAAGACLLLAPTRLKLGLGAVGVVLGAAPLAFSRTWSEAAAYALAVGLALAVTGLVRRDGALVAHGVLGAVVCATFLAREWGVSPLAPALLGALCTGSLLALRHYNRVGLAAVAGALLVLPWGQGMFVGLEDPLVLALLPVSAVLAGCAWAGDRRPLVWGAAACGGSLGVRLALPQIGPGIVLVALGFAGLPLGAWIGIKREQRAEALS